MRINVLAILATSLALQGCVVLSMASGAFSPVAGPLAGRGTEHPSYAATLNGVLSGTISVVFANGEVCKGNWAFVSSSPPASISPFDLAADWDLIYGPGFFTAHVLGNKYYARATLTGSMGSIVHVELSNEDNKAGNTHGVARDDKGNVFKVSIYN